MFNYLLIVKPFTIYDSLCRIVRLGFVILILIAPFIK